MRIYRGFNGPSATTAAPASVTTSGAIKTLLQIAPPSTLELKVIEWGISFDGSAAATPGKVELIETDVAATVTAFASLAIDRITDPGGIVSGVTLGTAASGYTATAEGTTTASRMFDMQLIAPTNQYVKQYPLGQEPRVQASKFLRVRVTFAVAVNAWCYIVWGE